MGTKNKKLFTEEEDKQIVEKAQEIGINKATIVLEKILGRSRRSIKERYQNCLDPSLDPNFTEFQDEKLISLVQQLGKKWKTISELIGNKSPSMVKGRYHRLIAKMNFGLVSDDGKHLEKYYERKFGTKNAKDSKMGTKRKQTKNLDLIESLKFDDFSFSSTNLFFDEDVDIEIFDI